MALATGFARSYRNDFFVRTEVNIIALQVAYALLILLFSVGALYILYNDIVTEIISAIATALTSTTTPLSTENLSLGLQAARTREIIGVTFFIFLGSLIFGYLAARFALAPARNALSAQKQFIGNVAHELRTPLAIIKANTEVRLLDENVPLSAREMHQSNLEELDRISDIINNLLSLSALIRPERIPFGNVDVAEIARRAIEKLSPAVKKKPVKLRVDVRTSHRAWGNASAIEQIVTNLVRNSTKFTDRGEIVVDIQDGPNETVELIVRDTGTGIKREHLYRVFEPFYRGDKARTRSGEKGSGSGLGLAIVNELVRLHQGRISIESTVGKGTTVTVTLRAGHEEDSPARTDELFASETHA